jgi:hypothetical protein
MASSSSSSSGSLTTISESWGSSLDTFKQNLSVVLKALAGRYGKYKTVNTTVLEQGNLVCYTCTGSGKGSVTLPESSYPYYALLSCDDGVYPIYVAMNAKTLSIDGTKYPSRWVLTGNFFK